MGGGRWEVGGWVVAYLLNSSKQHHAPEEAIPLKNLLMDAMLSPSEQLKTMHWVARCFARSLIVSVLPVP